MDTLLVDDEPHVLENLSILLNEHCPELNILGTASSALEAVRYIHKYRPEIVFMDVSMPHGSGFEVLDALDKIDFKLVFVTAHRDYAIEAIKRKAVDYILKPVATTDLKSCVARIKEEMRVSKSDKTKLVITTANSVNLVSIEDIVLCKSEGSYCHVYTNNGLHFFYTKQLKELELELPPRLFSRCHNSFLINKTFVRKYVKSEGGFLEMSTGNVVPISRGRRETVLKTLFETNW